MTKSNIALWSIAGVTILFFAAARLLPPLDTHAATMAVMAGYTNRTAPLVAILLFGGLCLGLLVFRRARDEAWALQAAPRAPWQQRDLHIAAACVLCVAVIALAPVWSAGEGYFGTRLALMDAGKVPYRDFEFAYGYGVAYLPYGLHRLGLSVSAALIVSLSLAAIAGVVSLAVIVERCISRSSLRLVLFWAMIVCAAFVGPGPSLNYNFGRYALPFALMVAISGATGWSTLRLFAATATAVLAVYLLSAEMAFAFCTALLAWVAVVARSIGVARTATVTLAILAVSVALLFAVPATFTTFGSYAGAQNLLPVVPNLIMTMTVASFLLCAAVNVPVALSLLRGDLEAGPALAAAQPVAFCLFAAALLPAVIGRAMPAITIAYGFVAIVMAIGYLDAAGAKWPATIASALFAAFVLYSAPSGLRTDASFVRHHGARPAPVPTAQRAFLKARFPNAYDPLLAVRPPSRGVTDVGYYPGVDSGDVIDDAGIARKIVELEHAPYYILPARNNGAPLPFGPSPQRVLHQFVVAGLYPFALRVHPGAQRFQNAFVVSLYRRCQPFAGVAGIVVCRLKLGA
jgi:hypothetical protein